MRRAKKRPPRRRLAPAVLVVAALSSALCLGFFGVVLLSPAPRDSDSPESGWLWSQSFQDLYDVSRWLGGGWGPQSDWGIQQRVPRSTLTLNFDFPKNQEITAKLSGRIITERRTEQTVSVLVNKVPVASLVFSNAYPIRSFAFLIPAGVLDIRSPPEMAFEASASPGAPALFGLEQLILTVQQWKKLRGSLDGCTPTTAAGWAIADGVPTPVSASSGGRIISARYRQVERSDLSKVGLPGDAGFILEWTDALPAGTEVAVGAAAHKIGQCRIP